MSRPLMCYRSQVIPRLRQVSLADREVSFVLFAQIKTAVQFAFLAKFIHVAP